MKRSGRSCAQSNDSRNRNGVSEQRQFLSGYCWPLALAGVAVVFSLGCSSRNEGTALQQSLLVAQQPQEVISLKKLQTVIDETLTVHVSGKIYADGLSPFDSQQAVFNIIDLPKPGHNHEDPGDCPFCKRDLENSASAIVQLVDDRGAIIQQPADHLLQLRENQDVIVTGTLKRVAEMMILEASGVHILSEEAALKLAQGQHSIGNQEGEL